MLSRTRSNLPVARCSTPLSWSTDQTVTCQRRKWGCRDTASSQRCTLALGLTTAASMTHASGWRGVGCSPAGGWPWPILLLPPQAWDHICQMPDASASMPEMSEVMGIWDLLLSSYNPLVSGATSVEKPYDPMMKNQMTDSKMGKGCEYTLLQRTYRNGATKRLRMP